MTETMTLTRRNRTLPLAWFVAALAALLVPSALYASGEEPAQKVTHTRAPAAPRGQPGDTAEEQWAFVDKKNAGCVSCHTKSDHRTMHASPAVVLSCADCHGGNTKVVANKSWNRNSMEYMGALKDAHVLPKYPVAWGWPSSANPKRSYALMGKESPEFIRFVNPSDYRVARESCGACHMTIIEASERSLMSTGAMLWGGAAYNNGIVPFKNYLFGESFTRGGEPALLKSGSKEIGPDGKPMWGTVTPKEKARGALPIMYPLPRWHTIPPGDVFRVFEDGGRTINPQFPEIGLPNSTGLIQRLEEPGRPDLKQSNRGPATGLRVAIPVLNIHKTRLNDPFLFQMGTNDQPGDYRSSGCAACHVIYANDREPRHSLNYAKCGRDGQTVTADPTINGLREGEHRKGAYGSYDAAKEEHHDKVRGTVLGGK
ncbi:MAG: cytochrome c3 family protein, partial [Pseudomonadota bacterium]